jgi:hypothetical protein
VTRRNHRALMIVFWLALGSVILGTVFYFTVPDKKRVLDSSRADFSNTGVEVLNNDPIQSDNRTWHKGDRCMLDQHGRSTEIDFNGEKAYRYTSPAGNGWGLECATGVIYRKTVR